ncbi:MAG TPA: leishmanolysin-related zinc metalloendopeptidase, partial [Gemmatimonadaceae bacterium]|nr:leishmanolysin-related zinc metalloendopeptidase [Gemmatimonadaceae bacterium]
GAVQHCVAAGGAGLCGQGSVPVENVGGAGTAEVHWREAAFVNELMTSLAEEGPMPLSAMTLASIEDLGLAVNYLAADPYSVPVPAAVALRPPAAAVAPAWEIVLAPLFDVTPSGWVRPLKTP